MASHYFTSTENVSELGDILKSKKFTELNPTSFNNNKPWDCVVINKTDGTYWYSYQNELSTLKSLLKALDSTLTKNITIKEIQEWQQKI